MMMNIIVVFSLNGGNEVAWIWSSERVKIYTQLSERHAQTGCTQVEVLITITRGEVACMMVWALGFKSVISQMSIDETCYLTAAVCRAVV